MVKMEGVGSVLLLSVAALLAGCNSDAASDASSAAFAGNVSADVPMTGGTLIATDSSTPARTFTAPLLADGSYSLNAVNGVAPFLLHAQVSVGSKVADLFSASAANSGKVDISPMTSLVIANAAGHDCAVTACTPATFTAARLTAAAAKVQTQLVPLLTQYGLAMADFLDSKQGNTARARKWVFFKHVAVGGYVYSRDGPLEFIKDTATGNWRMAGNQHAKAGAKMGKVADYVPPPGASSFVKWSHFSTESSSYPGGATLIAISSLSVTPAVTLVYMGAGNGAAKISGAEMIESVAGVSFLPACPRSAGQPGSCIDITQMDSYTNSAKFKAPAAVIHSQAANNSTTNGT